MSYNFTIGMIKVPPILIWEYDGEKFTSSLKIMQKLYEYAAHANIKLIPVLLEGEQSIGSFINGTWSGLLGMLQKKETELTAAQFCIELKDLPGVVIPVIYQLENYIITGTNKTQTKRADLIQNLSSIKVEMLLLIIFIIFFTAYVMNIFYSLNFESKSFKISIISYLKIFWILLTCNFKQTNCFIESFKVKIIYISFLFLVLINITFFTSLFSTNLIVQIKPDQVETIDDIVKKNLHPLFVEGEVVFNQVMSGSLQSFVRLKKIIFQYGVKSCFINANIESLRKASHDIYKNYAVIASEPFIKGILLNPYIGVFIQDEVSDLETYMSKQNVGQCLVMSRYVKLDNINHAKKFTKLIHLSNKLFESGTFEYLYHSTYVSVFPISWELRHQKEINKKDFPATPINMYEILTVLLLFLSFMFVALIVFLFEVFFFKCIDKKNSKIDNS